MDDEKYGKRNSSSFRNLSRSHFDDRKRKRLSSGHNDGSMSSKPIDTLYRILCPVKKIGSVLGKGGDIINALRDETHAKIRIADAIPGAEERVIIIFNHSSRQSGEPNSDQELDNVSASGNESENIKPHCPAQDALLKVNNRITADEVLHGGVVHEKNEPDGEVIARILVPNNQVGCLLGKGGTIIQKLRSDTGASIRILPSEHLPPCAMNSDELVQISGMPSVVKKALYEISTRLHQHPHKENPPLEDLIYASTRGLHESSGSMPPLPQGKPMWSHQYGRLPPPTAWFDGYTEPSGYAVDSYKSSRFNRETAEEFSVRMLCATGKIGGVIGKGGVNVRHLEQQTGARIQVDDTTPEAGERIIVISSKEVPSDQISPTIEALLMLQRKASAASENDVVTTRLLVPSSKVGCIIGQGGNIITEMRRRTRADIRVYSKEDKPKYTSADEELVQISGNPVVASEALKEIASRLRTRNFRSGTAAAVSPPPDPLYGFPPERMPSRGLPLSRSPAPFHEFPPPERMPTRGLPPSRSPAPFYGFPLSERMPTRGFPQSESPTVNSAPMGSFREYAPPESLSNRGLPSSGMSRAGNSSGYDHLKGSGQMHEVQRYPGPPTYSGYPNMNSSVEVRIPNSAVSSIVGAGGSTLSDIRQISGARIKLHEPRTSASEYIVEIHGTPDQTKAAESLLQAFIASSTQNMQPSEAPRLYQPSAWG